VCVATMSFAFVFCCSVFLLLRVARWCFFFFVLLGASLMLWLVLDIILLQWLDVIGISFILIYSLHRKICHLICMIEILKKMLGFFLTLFWRKLLFPSAQTSNPAIHLFLSAASSYYFVSSPLVSLNIYGLWVDNILILRLILYIEETSACWENCS
jgi:hypothetical protein